MSYILDALKKSEQERKLGGLPDISSEHQLLHKSSQHTWLLYLLAFLLSLIVLIALFFTFNYLNNKDLSEQTIKSSKLTGFDKTIEKNARNNTQQFSNSESIQSAVSSKEQANDSEIKSELEVIRPNKERRENLQESQKLEFEKNQKIKQEYQALFREEDAKKNENDIKNEQSLDSELESVHTEDEPIVENTELDWDDYPSIAELSPELKQTIPIIKVSTHIYSNVEGFRKVTVNGFSVKAKTEISEGLIVEAIVEEGVIFSFKGSYFKMKALEVWEG